MRRTVASTSVLLINGKDSKLSLLAFDMNIGVCCGGRSCCYCITITATVTNTNINIVFKYIIIFTITTTSYCCGGRSSAPVLCT